MTKDLTTISILLLLPLLTGSYINNILTDYNFVFKEIHKNLEKNAACMKNAASSSISTFALTTKTRRIVDLGTRE
jgi:hypothetical protein